MSQNLTLNVVLSAVDKLTAPFRNASTQVQKLSETLKNTKSELKGFEKTQNQISSWQRTTENINKATKAIDDHKAKISKLRGSINNDKLLKMGIKNNIDAEKAKYANLLDKQWSARNYGKGDLSQINAALFESKNRLETLTKQYDSLNEKIKQNNGKLRLERSAVMLIPTKMGNSKSPKLIKPIASKLKKR